MEFLSTGRRAENGVLVYAVLLHGRSYLAKTPTIDVSHTDLDAIISMALPI